MASQDLWRFCVKCHAMFFDGYPDKGKCAAGGGHQAMGYTFFLPFSPRFVPSGTSQHNWRFCVKCHAMFFDGYPNKGTCPAGGGHQAMGYNFVLPHARPATPPPVISATQNGASIIVSGRSFQGSSRVRIRVVVGVIGNEGSATTTSREDGSFEYPLPMEGVPFGTTIWISATDGRPNRTDRTGFLWSNTVEMTYT